MAASAATIMAIAYVISTIISVVGSVDMATANALANNKQSVIYKEARKILNDIASNKSKSNALYRAALNKQEALLREMITSHPVSSRSRSIMRQFINQSNIVNQHAADIDNADAQSQYVANNMQAEIAKNQTSGSFIGDMLNAGITKVKNKFKPQRQPGNINPKNML